MFLPTPLIIVTVARLSLISRQILLKIVFSLVEAWSVAATVGLKMRNINFVVKFLFYITKRVPAASRTSHTG